MLNYGSGLPAPWLKKKEDRAIAIIQEWLEKTDYQVYCSISGGKDSLVVTELITRVFPKCPLAWINQGPLAEWDDCVELINYWRDRGRNVIELCPPRSLLKLYSDYGIPLEGTMATNHDKQINTALMYNPLNEYQELNNIQGYAWGVRKSESRGRAMFLKSHGELHFTKAGFWVCSPVGFWKTEHIWQFIDRHKLPYPAMYDRDRATVRNGPPIGTTGVNWGRLTELRRYHPDKWAEFVKHFPEVQNYG